jgi:hypothetical protein
VEAVSALKILKLSDLPPSTYRPRYAVLVDKLPDEVNAFAREHPGVFVFTVLAAIPDPEVSYLDMEPSGYVAQPLYVGNVCGAVPEDIGRQIAVQVLGPDAVDISERP